MDYFKIGQIINTHGIKGEVKIYPYTDDILNLTTLSAFYLDEKLKKCLNVESSRVVKDFLYVKFKEINSLEDAILYKTKYLYIKRYDDDLEENEYYISDLLEMQVILINEGKKESIGTLNYIFNTGANDVYEIKLNDGNMIYIPAIKDVIYKVDTKEKKIYINKMEGLI